MEFQAATEREVYQDPLGRLRAHRTAMLHHSCFQMGVSVVDSSVAGLEAVPMRRGYRETWPLRTWSTCWLAWAFTR